MITSGFLFFIEIDLDRLLFPRKLPKFLNIPGNWIPGIPVSKLSAPSNSLVVLMLMFLIIKEQWLVEEKYFFLGKNLLLSGEERRPLLDVKKIIRPYFFTLGEKCQG